MAMSSGALQKLVWVSIFGGILTLSLGLFVLRRDPGLGHILVTAGVVLVVVGAVLVWVRARRPEV
jgi:hypothetical protein